MYPSTIFNINMYDFGDIRTPVIILLIYKFILIVVMQFFFLYILAKLIFVSELEMSTFSMHVLMFYSTILRYALLLLLFHYLLHHGFLF